jgi:dienelactone hydrolase
MHNMQRTPNTHRTPVWSAFALVLFPIISGAVQIYDKFPDSIRADERYVIYSHGLIVEGDDPKPISPKYGQYDFPGIKQAIFNGGGFNLIAVQRAKSSDDAYADTLKSWVRRLLAAGVKPSRITLVGFSRGAHLTALASSGLVAERINTAIMAICEGGDVAQTPPLTLGGNLLSIYETSDELGPCTKLAARSHLTSFKEVAVSTGKKHGAFFQPLPEWVQPLRAWIAKTNR